MDKNEIEKNDVENITENRKIHIRNEENIINNGKLNDNNTEKKNETKDLFNQNQKNNELVLQDDMMKSIKKHKTTNNPTDTTVIKKKKTNLLKEMIEWVLYIAAAFLLASLIQSEVFALTEVNMSSMETTLIPHDKLVMNKLAYRFAEPKKGDILVFLKDETEEGFSGRISVYLTDVQMKLHGEFRRNRLIKRVIAVAGDTIEIKNNVVMINGEIQNEPYARIDPDENRVVNGEMQEMVVPAGKIFVMGDNRAKSMDSRAFGVIDLASVEGKAAFRVMPLSKLGSIY